VFEIDGCRQITRHAAVCGAAKSSTVHDIVRLTDRNIL